jgi:hypothetical protein
MKIWLGTLTLLFSLALGARANAANVVISDIDDTIEFTHLRAFAPGLKAHLNQFLGLARALVEDDDTFIGMPSLYLELATEGYEIRYVTGALGYFADEPDHFLEETGFPSGAIDVRPNAKVATEDFKVAKIKDIMLTRPEADFILIGDNGQRDIASYGRLQADPQVQARISAVYIHRIYPVGIGMALQPGQVSFFTAADLAVQMYLGGKINSLQTEAILKMVDVALAGKFKRLQDRAFPRHTVLTGADLAELNDLNSRLLDPQLHNLFESVIGHLQSRRK